MKLTKSLPRGKKGGVVTNVVMGVGALIIGVIITFVIVSTLNDAELLGLKNPTSTVTITNETGATVNASANITTYSVDGINNSNSAYALTTIWGFPPQLTPTNFNYSIALANATISNAGVVENASEFNVTVLSQLSISYTLQTLGDSSPEQASVDRLVDNFTEGVDNVGDKIPVILLIVAVVFLFGALVLLVQQSKKMGIGSSSSL